MRSEHPAVGAAGTTRFGDRTRRGTAASFRCARCGELADLVRVAQAGTTVDTGRPPGSELTATGLDLDCFLGTSRHPAEAGIVDAVQAARPPRRQVRGRLRAQPRGTRLPQGKQDRS